jgi:hypothetical protein
MKKLTIKQTEDKLVLKFEDSSQQEADYWEGIYLKQLYYNTMQMASRSYAYIDREVVAKMLPEEWYIDFHVVNQASFFELKNFQDYYMSRWFGEAITLRLLSGYSIEFTKMQFTEDGKLVV